MRAWATIYFRYSIKRSRAGATLDHHGSVRILSVTTGNGTSATSGIGLAIKRGFLGRHPRHEPEEAPGERQRARDHDQQQRVAHPAREGRRPPARPWRLRKVLIGMTRPGLRRQDRHYS